MERPEYKADYYEDRINLYYYIQVIWRWKFIIVGIIIVSVIAAILMSFTITPVYSVSASLIPGAIDVEDETGQRELVDPIDDIVTYINGGIYNPQIIKFLNLDPRKYSGLQFIAKKPENAYIINVYYETTDPAQGEVIVGELLSQIEKSYLWKITKKKKVILDSFEKKLNDIVNEIELNINNMKLLKNNIKLLKNAENKMKNQIMTVDDNTKSIMKQRNRLLSEGGEGDTVALLLYSNTIQQNLAYKDTLNTALQNNRTAQVDQQNKLEKFEIEIHYKFLEIEKLITEGDIAYEFTELLSKFEYILKERPSVKHFLEKFKEAKIVKEAAEAKIIQVIQDPRASSKPINIRRVRMVMISGFFSLFLGFFLALIIDFIKKSKASSSQS